MLYKYINNVSGINRSVNYQTLHYSLQRTLHVLNGKIELFLLKLVR